MQQNGTKHKKTSSAALNKVTANDNDTLGNSILTADNND